MKIIKSEDSLDRFNEAGLAEVLKSSLRKYKYLLYIYISNFPSWMVVIAIIESTYHNNYWPFKI